MGERVQSFWSAVKEWWDRLSRIARIILLCAMAGVIILGLILVFVLNQKDYYVLYNDLNTSESAKALSILSEAGITARLEPNGAITVEEKDLDRARMRMASAGFQAADFGYDTYNPGLTATQTDKNRYYNWQNQDRIQAMIETFEEVSQAVVNINAPEQNAFVLQSEVIEPSAAVVLTMRPGKTLTSQQVQGIINVVKDSVPNIKEENISVTDQNGDLRSGLNANADINNEKLRLKAEVDDQARKRVLSVIQPVYGPGNVEVQCSANLDTDERVAESITYHPFDENNPANNPRDYDEHYREKNDAPGGVAEGVVGANDNVGTPQYGEEAGEEAGYAAYSSHDIYDYLVSSTKEQIKKSGLDITDMTVAVIVNAATLPDGQRDQLISLAANAAGVAAENVTVQNIAFAKSEGAADTQTGWSTTQWLLLAGVILLLLIVLTVIIIVIITKKKKREEAEGGEEALYDEDGMPLVDLLSAEEDFEPITIVETQEQKLKAQIKDLADSDPEIVASLIKNWLG